MAKRKRGEGKPFGAPKEQEQQSSRLTVSSYQDVADSEDEFHNERDKILLDEGAAAKRVRQWKEQDEFLEVSDEEVLAYSDQDDTEEDVGGAAPRVATVNDAEASDEEEQSAEEEEALEGWGPSKKDYYNADVIETEQDAQDEENEARRLQQKRLQSMSEADFGFDEDAWVVDGQDLLKNPGDVPQGDVFTERLPQFQITADMGPGERLKVLRSRYPECELLMKELVDLAPLHTELQAAANAARGLRMERASQGPSTVIVKWQALAAYTGSLSMYFALLTSPSSKSPNSIAMDPTELHNHPVMDSIVKCRQLWNRVRNLPTSHVLVDYAEEDALSENVEDLALNTASDLVEENTEQKAPRKQKKTKAQRAAERAQIDADARRAERLRKTEADLATLSALKPRTKTIVPTPAPTLQGSPRSQLAAAQILAATAADQDSDLGDETELTSREQQEKARKRKSLASIPRRLRKRLTSAALRVRIPAATPMFRTASGCGIVRQGSTLRRRRGVRRARRVGKSWAVRAKKMM